MQIPITEIITWATSNVVVGALLVSLVGATIAMAVRHKTSNNWKPNLEDVRYYVLSGSVGVALVLLGTDTATILAATTGINTPLALIQTAIERKSGIQTPLVSATDEQILAEAAKRAEAVA